jgi:hypothetical protein
MNVGETFPIQLVFDGQPPVQIIAIADQEGLATAAVLPKDEVIEQFRKAHELIATFREQTYQFDLYLSSTGQLLPVIANCVAKVKASGVANAGDFSVLPSKPPAPTPPKSEATASVPKSHPVPPLPIGASTSRRKDSTDRPN